jgi:ferrous iron transport protein A
MRTVLIILTAMDAFAAPGGAVIAPGSVSLSALLPRTTAIVRGVGSRAIEATPLERRLIELGFVSGERVEVLTQVSPGGDPFVLRIGDTTFALRRREVATVWVEEVAPCQRSP